MNQDKESAIKDCSKAIELNPSYLKAYLRRAQLYEQTDNLDQSLADYKKIIELDPGNSEAQHAVRVITLVRHSNLIFYQIK